MTDEEILYAAVQDTIDALPENMDISPAWIATRVMIKIQFPRELHNLGYVGCHLEVRQIARGKLRKRFDPEERAKDAAAGQGDMFSGILQDYYPRCRTKDEDPIYAPLSMLTEDDVEFNVERMRLAGHGLLRHADALEAWGRGRKTA